MPLTSTQHRRKCQHSHRVPTTQRPNRPWRRPAWHLALGLAPLLQPPTTQTTEKQGEEMACDSSAQTHLSHQSHWAEVDCAVLFQKEHASKTGTVMLQLLPQRQRDRVKQNKKTGIYFKQKHKTKLQVKHSTDAEIHHFLNLFVLVFWKMWLIFWSEFHWICRLPWVGWSF